ncbi:glucose-1-phosphate adenylyltransferase [Pelotomaculum isophthalicicum JI]|uniref:Glucose-1-phosphate adenylyltransferase n=1 Tax=Pelotomaculum isophthalicicum JI TaxID=947010 RepID=A0A9X4H8A4_9FIRM|nr:glucose-1-phosphate adenylyltransferase [Pelotomaculum isophthalicicum]MDF9408764.1 glucose-1-phosphate adenylyltransferase [Pelotomaculum isophthalicicum JI]
MYKKEVIAMLLAGGQGSRLGCLTRNIPKPALSFGAKYRIIDFSLSNCVNSNIDTVGVLTQYKHFLLNSYIGTGLAWDLDNNSHGGVHILPPFVRESGGSWYKGTANAIYQNIDFINFYNPEYVLIISGDHVYKMNYEAMLTYHKEQNADVTVSVLEVPSEEVSRFGIVTADKQGRIFKFTEKPKESDSNLASMGIYIFNWPVLKRALIEDEENPDSNNDFGQNVLPMLLNKEKRLFAYGFQGYWKDVGTIESYYDANMELLKEKPSFDIFESDIRIFSNDEILPPHYIGPKARVNNCLIGNGCKILGEIKNSIVASGVYVGERCRVEDSILLPNSKIMNDSRVYKAIIGEHTSISAFSFISSIKKGVNTRQAEITVVERSGIITEDFQALA